MTLLELVDVLGTGKPLNTIRLVWFGVEEQLAVESTAYAVGHQREMPEIGVVFNLDNIASAVDHHCGLRDALSF